MMVQRDKDELQRTWHSEKARWDSAAKDKELAIQLSKTADLEMRRDISELTGQLHAMKVRQIFAGKRESWRKSV
jgi:hypothetical protein